MYEEYKDRAAFFVVYIQEAHPTDLWQLPSNVKDGVLFASPQNDGERTETATACVRKLGIKLPAVLDGIDNKTERAYTGWPDRLYVIDMEGRVRFKSAPGPLGFSTTDLEAALKQVLAAGTRSEPRSGVGWRPAQIHQKIGSCSPSNIDCLVPFQ